jgi:hypothetical protein
MNEQTAELLIRAPQEQLRAILLNPVRLPDWNPAIRTLTGPFEAEAGARYPITARGGLSGFLAYTAIEPQRITILIRVQGLMETGWWQTSPQGALTRVRHGFAHQGPLALLLSRAFSGVAALRLDRLAQQV